MRYALTIVVFLFLILPVSSVEGAGLVPCGGTGQPPCQFCYLVELTNNVVEWTIGILALLAVIAIMVAGFISVTSQGQTNGLERIKTTLSNIFLGILFALAAWLIINTIMVGLLSTEKQGLWNTFTCVDQPVPDGNYFPPQTFFGTIPTGIVTPRNIPTTGLCSVDALSPYFGEQARNAACIINDESACGAQNVSRTDVLTAYPNRPAFSFGPMQINLTVHELRGCDGYPPVMRCLDAFSGRNYDAIIVDQALYEMCAEAAMRPQCNLLNGARIYREARNSWRPWSTAENCRLL